MAAVTLREGNAYESLSGLDLVTVPQFNGPYHYIVTLDLSHNQLTMCCTDMSNMVSLRQLDLSCNQLELMPIVGSPPNLHRLNLSGNQLTSCYNPDWQLLQRLEKLHLDTNCLTCLDPSLQHLSGLRKLTLHKNALQSTDYLPSSLHILQLSVGHLRSQPTHIYAATNLTSLCITSGDFVELPTAIANLPNLESLEIKSCYLQRVSPAIGQLRHLRALNLHNNMLSELPDTLQHCQKLSVLNLSFNIFKEIPVCCSLLPHLRTLKMAGCNITHVLPARYPSLRVLDLQLNLVCTQPPPSHIQINLQGNPCYV